MSDDNLKAEIERLKAENRRLQRALEDAQIDRERAIAGASGVVNKDNDILNRFRDERDAWQHQIERWYSYSTATADKSLNMVDSYIRDAKQANKGTQSSLARGILFIMTQTYFDAEKAINKAFPMTARAIVQAGSPLDNDKELAIAQIMRNGVVIGIHQFALHMASEAMLMSQNPHMACNEILLELAQTGKVRSNSLNNLPSRWIRDNLTHKRKSTLRKALEVAQKVEDTSIQDVVSNTLNEKTIEAYRRDYNKIRETAEYKDEWLAKILDFRA
jgi:hypothetical protein